MDALAETIQRRWFRMTREEAIKTLGHVVPFATQNSEKIAEAIDMAIEALSADAVQVVRCKDCKHKYVSGNGTTQYYVCDFMDAQYEDNGFCHHGECKGGGTE